MRLLLNIGLQVGATQTLAAHVVNTDFATLPAPLGPLTQDAKTQAEMDAYDAKTWRIFCVLIVMLFVTGVTAWGLVS